MIQISTDISILGIVFAVILLIIVFSAIILYLAFRIKETFREEKRRGMLVAKIAFLVGTLFLAGGIFYFFAGTLTPMPSPTPSPTPTPSLTPTPSPTPTPTQTPTPTPPSNETGKPSITLIISYPTKVRLKADFILSFTIINPTEYIAHSVTIQANVLFEYFKVIPSTHEVIGNVIKVGDVPPGTTIISIKLAAPERPGEVRDTVILTFKEMSQPISQNIAITVTGGQ